MFFNQTQDLILYNNRLSPISIYSKTSVKNPKLMINNKVIDEICFTYDESTKMVKPDGCIKKQLNLSQKQLNLKPLFRHFELSVCAKFSNQNEVFDKFIVKKSEYLEAFSPDFIVSNVLIRSNLDHQIRSIMIGEIEVTHKINSYFYLNTVYYFNEQQASAILKHVSSPVTECMLVSEKQTFHFGIYRYSNSNFVVSDIDGTLTSSKLDACCPKQNIPVITQIQTFIGDQTPNPPALLTARNAAWRNKTTTSICIFMGPCPAFFMPCKHALDTSHQKRVVFKYRVTQCLVDLCGQDCYGYGDNNSDVVAFLLGGVKDAFLV